MKKLTKKECELVSIGAAIASNCIPCAIYHVNEAKKNGINDKKILEAIEIAEKVRKIPNERVLASAFAHLNIKSDKNEKSNCEC